MLAGEIWLSNNNPSGPKGNSPRFEVVFVIQSKDFSVSVNPNQAVRGAVQQALQESGNQGSVEGWQLRTEDGRLLDLQQSFESQGITKAVKLFMSKGAGRGGSV